MKVKCTNNNDVELKLNKEYEVKDESNQSYYVVDELGHTAWYLKHRFKIEKPIIYCINNKHTVYGGGECNLTLGEQYEIIDEDDNNYIIKNDKNKEKRYRKDKFVTDKFLAEKILDRNKNPDLYFKPIDIALYVNYDCNNSISYVGMILKDIDDDLVGLENINEFLGVKTAHNIVISNNYKYMDLKNKLTSLQLGKQKNVEQNIYSSFKNNEVIDVVYKINKTIEEINNKLIYTKKEKGVIYSIEHEPNGKRYSFKSDEDLYIGELVICETSLGNKYGVVKSIENENLAKRELRKKCRRIR